MNQSNTSLAPTLRARNAARLLAQAEAAATARPFGKVPEIDVLLEENTDPDNQGDLHEAFDAGLDLADDDPDAHRDIYGGVNQWPEIDGFRELMVEYHNVLGRAVFATMKAGFTAEVLCFCDERLEHMVVDAPFGAVPADQARSCWSKKLVVAGSSGFSTW